MSLFHKLSGGDIVSFRLVFSPNIVEIPVPQGHDKADLQSAAVVLLRIMFAELLDQNVGFREQIFHRDRWLNLLHRMRVVVGATEEVQHWEWFFGFFAAGEGKHVGEHSPRTSSKKEKQRMQIASIIRMTPKQPCNCRAPLNHPGVCALKATGKHARL